MCLSHPNEIPPSAIPPTKSACEADDRLFARMVMDLISPRGEDVTIPQNYEKTKAPPRGLMYRAGFPNSTKCWTQYAWSLEVMAHPFRHQSRRVAHPTLN